jgi:hypothetical protein
MVSDAGVDAVLFPVRSTACDEDTTECIKQHGCIVKSLLVVLQQIESSCCLVPLSDVWLLTAAALVLAAGAVALASTQHCLDLCHHVQLLWCYSKAVQHE